MNYWVALLLSFASGAASMGITMYTLGWRRIQCEGKTKLVPEVDHRPLVERLHGVRRQHFSARRLFVAFGLLLSLTLAVSTVQLYAFIKEQRGCNSEFKRTVRERADATANNERARADNDQALLVLAEGLLSPHPEMTDQQRRDYTRKILQDFADTSATVQERQAQTIQVRIDNPYPRC